MDFNCQTEVELSVEALASQIEALLFAYAEPLSYKKIATILGCSFDEIKTAAMSLKSRLDEVNSAIELVELNLSLQLLARSIYDDIILRLFDSDKKRGLSQAQLEVLSILAYQQPATKRDIERIRGVKSDRVVQSLIELELIQAAGKKDAPGMPVLFATTESFLRQFGLRSLLELPVLKDEADLKLFEDQEI